MQTQAQPTTLHFARLQTQAVKATMTENVNLQAARYVSFATVEESSALLNDALGAIRRGNLDVGVGLIQSTLDSLQYLRSQL